MMILNNKFTEEGASAEMFGQFVQLLAPFAPHLAEELWQKLGNKESVFTSTWPTYDPEKITAAVIEIPVQVNSKIRSRLFVAPDTEQKELEEKAKSDEKVKQYLEGKNIKKIIFVPNKILNIITD